jgi:tetratricopeptide (TPR) repeat protein
MKQAATLIFSLLATSPWAAIATNELHIAQNDLQKVETIDASMLTSSEVSADVLFKLLSAELAISRNQLDFALKNYIDVAKETQDSKVAQRATQIALSIASLEEAYIPGKIWADHDETNLEAQITFVAVLIRLAKLDESVKYLTRITKLDPLDADRHFVMLYKQLPDEADRQNVVESLELLKDKVKNNLALVALADILLMQNQIPKGIQYAEQALKINEQDPKASILYAQGLTQNQQINKAAVFLDSQTQKMPKSLHLHQYYTQFLLDNNQPQKALEQMKKIEQLENLTSKQRLQLARLSMQAGWLDTAEAFLHTVRKDKKQVDTANYFLARLFESKNEALEAANWYKQVKQGPFHIIAYIRATALLTELKEYDQALQVIDNAEPQNYADLKRLLLARVDILTTRKDNQGAFDLLSQAIQSEPEDMDFLYSRAIIADKLNKLNIAENDLKAVLSQDPNHIDALNALGFILSNKTTRYQEAQELIMKALHLSPNNPSILDSLGWIKYKMGKTDEAIVILKKAFNLYPDPEIAAHLGEVLWSMNQVDEANKIWSDALKSSPDNEDVIQTMKRLVGENGH